MSVFLQNWIHRLEEGAGVAVIRFATATIVFFSLMMVHHLRESRSLGAPEAMDAAQLGRSIARGEGFETKFIRPYAIQLTQVKTGVSPDLTQPFQDVSNAPAWPWLLGKVFRLTASEENLQAEGQEVALELEKRIRWLNQILFYLVLVVLFRTAVKLFDERVAWLSVILLGGANVFWNLTLAGVSVLLSTLLLLLSVWAFVSAVIGEGEKEWGAARVVAGMLVAGLLFGLCGLTSYGLLWLLIPFAVVVPASLGRFKVPATIAFLLAVLVVVVPWLMRNQGLSGQFFGTAGSVVYADTLRFPEDRLERGLFPPDSASAQDAKDYSVQEHWMKFRGNIGKMLTDFIPGMAGGWIFGFFIAGLMLSFSRPVLTRLRWLLMGGIMIMTLVQALGQSRMLDITTGMSAENYLLNLGPLVVLFGVAMFSTLLDQMAGEDLPFQRIVMSALCVLLCLPLVIRLLEPKQSIELNPPYYPEIIAEGASWLEEDEWMMSDMPWAVAWYGDRECVWCTWDVDREFIALHRARPIAALYLTSVTLDRKLVSELERGENKLWGMLATEAIVNGEIPVAFPLEEGFSEWFPWQLYLSDKPRWQDRAANIPK